MPVPAPAELAHRRFAQRRLAHGPCPIILPEQRVQHRGCAEADRMLPRRDHGIRRQQREVQAMPVVEGPIGDVLDHFVRRPWRNCGHACTALVGTTATAATRYNLHFMQ